MRSNLLVSLFLAGLIAGSGPACGPSSAKPGPIVPAPVDPTPTAPTDILAASDLPVVQTEPLPFDRMDATIHRLSNGMTVYISPNKDKPRLSAWIAVRAGSRHDPPDSTGLAHYLEHMLFKGTSKLGTLDFAKERPHLERIESLYAELRVETDDARRSEILAEIDGETQKTAQYAIPNEFDQLYASLGIQGLNAFTSDEQTVYIADVPSNRFDAWVAVESARFQDPQFRLFYPELEAVYEEKNRSLDSAQSRVFEELARTLYPKHPYGTQPTIGIVAHLKNPAYGDMVRYFDTWYVPNNMAIVLAGDIDAKTAIPALEKTFGSMTPKALPKLDNGEIVPIEGRVERTVTAEGENAVYLAWPTVHANHQDRTALEVMDWLVDNSTSGLLNIDLVLTQKLPRAGSFADFSNEAGSWILFGTARSGQSHAAVEELLTSVVAKLKTGEFEQSDLDAIITNAEIQEKRQLESNGSRVSAMTRAFIAHTPWEQAAQRIERLRKVTREDVMRVANEYLTDNLVVIRRQQGSHEPPKITKPSITPIDIDTSRRSRFAQDIAAMEARELEPEWLVEGKHFARHKLPAGDMVAVKNARNDLFALTYRFEIGSVQRRLLCHALELWDRSGMIGISAADLKKKLYAMGTSIDSSCDDEITTLNVSGIDRNLESSVVLLDAWLRNAAFTNEDVSKLAENRISQRKDQMEEPSFLASALAEYAMRGNHSQYLLAPSNKELERAKGSALARLLAKLPDHQHKTSYFGPRSGDEAAKLVALGKNHKKVKPRPPMTYRKVRGTAVFFANKKVAQAQIRFLFPTGPITEDDRAVSRLYTEYVGGGMGSLVFQELREARGLAYSAWAIHRANSRKKDDSGVMGGIGTQVDKTNDALDAMFGLLRDLKVDPSRFAIAKESLDQEYRASRVDPRFAASWVWSWDELGYTEDPRPAQWQALSKMGPEALEGFANKAIKEGLIVAIMADPDRLDMKLLKKKLATPKTLGVEKLVSY